MSYDILKLENLTCDDLDSFDKTKTAFFVPISPLEQHGPHLPVGVDLFNAEYSALKAAEYLKSAHADFNAVIYPSIPLGTQVYRYTGSFGVKQTTLYEIIFNIGKSLAGSGFKHIFVFSAHGTARQIVGIEAACKSISKKYKINMHCLTGNLSVRFLKGEFYSLISDKIGRKFNDVELKTLKYDYHAGWWETSMMLLNYPDLVKPIYKKLPAYLKDVIKRKVITPEVKFKGYIGGPSYADKEFAKASVAVMTEVIGDQIDRCLRGADISDDVTSPLYRYRFLRPHFKRNIRIGIVIFIKILVIIYIISKYI